MARKSFLRRPFGFKGGFWVEQRKQRVARTVRAVSSQLQRAGSNLAGKGCGVGSRLVSGCGVVSANRD